MTFYEAGQRNKDQVKADFQAGKDRAQSQAASAQSEDEGAETSTQGASPR